MENPFRNLPSVTQLLDSPPLKRLVHSVNHHVVVDGVRSFLDNMRQQMTKTAERFDLPTTGELAETIASWLQNERRPMLRPVINGTGILLHTGLGRAPLAERALQAIQSVAAGYSSLEVDLETGQRGQRAEIVKRLICELTGSDDAAVANNNAAATMITLSSMAAGREVIVSRGQLIEIGGSYRLPEVMTGSGCVLREIGTTNKTRIEDYEAAINDRTGAILRVHPSNFQVVGFSETPALKEIVQVARRHSLPVIDDIGSGALIDFSAYGLKDEPVARDSIEAGADVVLFSGDKLVGGPQSGIIAGSRHWVRAILKNPLMRAMRVDKLTLAALVATLELYSSRETAEQQIPLLAMLATSLANLEMRAKKIAGQISHLDCLSDVSVVNESSMLGGGSIPTQEIPTFCVSFGANAGTIDDLAKSLRCQDPAIMGRINRNRMLLDLRTIHPRYDVAIVTAFERLSSAPTKSA